MPSISADARFLGLDLRTVWREVQRPWLRMHEWRALRWLTPKVPVRVLRAHGGEAIWRGESRRPDAAAGAPSRFTAVELPDDLVLRRTLPLPWMSPADTARAMELQARALSPFAPADLASGWRLRQGEGRREAEIALASRRQIAHYLEGLAPRLSDVVAPEVWVCPDDAAPIVLAGYGEGVRGDHAVRQRRWGYGLLGTALLLVLAMALTPTAQLWVRAQEAAQAYGALGPRSREVLAQREVLTKSVEQLNLLAEALNGRVDPLRVLEVLTQTLPDDTALQSVKLQGESVTISGMTGNAATLMQLLGEQPGLRDVRAPSPATRLAGATKEQFVIAFALDPARFAVLASPPAVAASAASVAAAPAASSPAQAVASAAPASAASFPAGAASAPAASTVAAPATANSKAPTDPAAAARSVPDATKPARPAAPPPPAATPAAPGAPGRPVFGGSVAPRPAPERAQP